MPNGKPNIPVIWDDDIGQSNLGCHTRGLMDYHTPNNDRIVKRWARTSADDLAELRSLSPIDTSALQASR